MLAKRIQINIREAAIIQFSILICMIAVDYTVNITYIVSTQIALYPCIAISLAKVYLAGCDGAVKQYIAPFVPIYWCSRINDPHIRIHIKASYTMQTCLFTETTYVLSTAWHQTHTRKDLID